MTGKEAEQILDWLTGSFGKRLQENERLVWLATLAEMDADRAMQIALQIAKNGERFPTVPEFRKAVRVVQSDDSWRDLPPERLQIPEWVSVWWHRRIGHDDFRPFPQQFPKSPDAISMQEYEKLRAEWKEAGSPKVGSIQDLIRAI